MRVDDITVKVTTVVLQHVKASLLLADAETACFAAGADKEGRSADELCAEVAAALRVRDASWAERHMAVVAAAMRGRYKSMVRAMEQANLQPAVVEDLKRPLGNEPYEDRCIGADYHLTGRAIHPEGSFANGGAMRIAPVGLAFRFAPDPV